MKLLSLAVLLAGSLWAQDTDAFVMGGADVTRPGRSLRGNLNLGIGHAVKVLRRFPLGDEVTASYAYENCGPHGFFHTAFGCHTAAAGLMRNVSLSGRAGLYTWLMGGATVLTRVGDSAPHPYAGAAVGLVLHFDPRNAVWIQQIINHVGAEPWYLTSSIGYTYSFTWTGSK